LAAGPLHCYRRRQSGRTTVFFSSQQSWHGRPSMERLVVFALVSSPEYDCRAAAASRPLCKCNFDTPIPQRFCPSTAS
jgi:hypothetical protein